MEIPVIYLDENMVVVNKPAGLVVHGSAESFSEKGAYGETLASFLLQKFPEMKNVGDEPQLRPGIVHRLDKDTSGVMVAARNQQSFEALKNLFKNRLVEKIYRAIVCGKVAKERGIVSLAIGRLVKNPLKRGVDGGRRPAIRGGREAITEFRVLKQGKEYSLLELRPKTGRMHQLRVHLKAIGHPVACDKVYGGKNICCPEGVSRQLLHAQSLTFSFPTGRRLYFEADLPQDFEVAMRQIL